MLETWLWERVRSAAATRSRARMHSLLARQPTTASRARRVRKLGQGAELGVSERNEGRGTEVGVVLEVVSCARDYQKWRMAAISLVVASATRLQRSR